MRARARNSEGLGPWGSWLAVHTNHVPDTPTWRSPPQLDSSPTLVRVGWNAPNDHGSQILAYFLAVNGDEAGRVFVEPSKTDYILSDLEPATEHTFKVQAVNSYGSSEWSDAISARTRMGHRPSAARGRCQTTAQNGARRYLWVVERSGQRWGRQHVPAGGVPVQQRIGV